LPNKSCGNDSNIHHFVSGDQLAGYLQEWTMDFDIDESDFESALITGI
jgi:hypothetical protein